MVAGHALVFMERAAAGCLHHRVWLGQLDEAECAYVVCRLLWAVQRMAEEGWHHGDFKPANLLVAADGRLVVGDFNVATTLDEHGRAAAFSGTQGFMAPEVERGWGSYDVRAESFSIGRCVDSLVDRAGFSRWSELGKNVFARLTMPDVDARLAWGSTTLDLWLEQCGYCGGGASDVCLPPASFKVKAQQRAASIEAGY